MKQRDEEFAEYFDARVVSMRRTAYLLCGDWHRAEDLVQTALTKIYVAWPRINRGGTVDAYARQVLVRSAIDESRRGFRKRETALPEVPEHGTPAHDVGETVDLRNALAALPPGQRAAVVLRYWEDQSVEATAQLLGCSTGTVKSQTARGLAALRKLLGSAQPATGGYR
ncbi:RNA polymerase sigma-70 factor (sigma-E family) [Saccharopolyspora erythraea NRRL 2338]|uniref:RNA polymerase ECF sigma factor n=2 Tax=Saccharopolyspora erythraea TaxID=1836 RepID=A4F9Q1_SACEN|nr:SigE family RNA polymerase sigma factor [Saccharopolyspora erythraea]EQD84575.1 RNA polymerase sigma24 factor [Saccharopolyspora erythraea D]PFG94562.1 RNA polymerase sigma-70 factor (sigma-E family) [Saccharopolyspora erythraea NRRL 2338]QRK91305.1 SigE family RNA polymerase sigma factor [Saccharopolyspora erythraea]CAM00776.1 RNA polymerase ECF sigma factor [Saccharopolyspora erythraea NRRL 2338]